METYRQKQRKINDPGPKTRRIAKVGLGIPFLGPPWSAVREAGLVGVQSAGGRNQASKRLTDPILAPGGDFQGAWADGSTADGGVDGSRAPWLSRMRKAPLEGRFLQGGCELGDV